MNTTCVHIRRDGTRCTNLIKDSGHCSLHVKVYRLRRAERGDWVIGTPVDATAVKHHLARLHAANVGTRRIAELTGLTPVTIRVILNKDQQRVHPNTAARILAVPVPDVPHHDSVADATLVSALGTQRRLQALVALGHTQEHICAELGVAPNAFARIIARQNLVTAAYARRVAAVYEQMHMTPGTSGKSTRRARRLGWAAPLAWDDNTIDDPDARPYVAMPERVTFTEKYRELMELGYNDDQIATKLGYTNRDNFERHLYRVGLRPRRAHKRIEQRVAS